MPLFPMFVDLKNKNVLVVGGGTVAQRKIEKLIPFKPKIEVVAKNINRDIKKLAKDYAGIILNERAFDFLDLKNKDIVIVAVDDISLQKEIYEECIKRKIPVNSVDSPDYCSFIFPALVVKGELVIGISTSGTVPGLSAKVRKHIEKCLPENIEEILNELKHIRETLPKGEERQRVILQKVEELFEKFQDI